MEQSFENNQEMQGSGESDILLAEVSHIFSFSERREQEVLLLHFAAESRVELSPNHRFQEALNNQQIDEDQIRRTSVTYRLRFLPKIGRAHV